MAKQENTPPEVPAAYPASPPLITRDGETGEEYVTLKPMVPGARVARVPRSMASVFLNRGYVAATEEDLKIEQYAQEHLGAYNRVAALAGDYAPIIGAVTGTVDRVLGMSAEEMALRKQAAETYTDSFTKNTIKTVAGVGEFAATGIAGKVAEGALGTVKGAAALGGVTGAASSAQMYLENPEVSGQALTANLLSHIALAAGSTFLVGKGLDKVQKKMQADVVAKSLTPAGIQETDKIAFRALKAAGLGTKEIKRVQRSEPGALTKYAKEANEMGLVKNSSEELGLSVANLKSKAQATFDEIEARAVKEGDYVSANSLIQDLKEIAKEKIKKSPTEKGNIMREYIAQREALLAGGDMNITQVRAMKKSLYNLTGMKQRATNDRSINLKQEFYSSAWKKLDDYENRIIQNLDETGDTFKRWQTAQKEFAKASDFKNSAAALMGKETAEASKGGMEKMNALLGLGFALSGNTAGVIFNAGWLGFNAVRKYTNSASYLANKLEPGVLKGVTRQIYELTDEKIREQAWQLTRPVASKVGPAVDEMVRGKEAERQAADTRLNAIREHSDVITAVLHEQFGNGANFMNNIGVFDELQHSDPATAQAALRSAVTMQQAIRKHLPTKKHGKLMDTGDDVELPLSDMEREKTVEALQAIIAPTDVMNNPTALQARILHDTYPHLMNQLRQYAAEGLAKAHEDKIAFTLEDKEKLSTTLRMDASVDTDKKMIARIQAELRAQNTKNSEPPDRSPSRAGFGKTSSSNATTPSERVGKL
jgi:hypothetical protein